MSDKEVQLVLDVFTSVQCVTDFINEFKGVQRNKLMLGSGGASMFVGSVRYFNSEDYFQRCAVYLVVARMCMEDKMLSGDGDERWSHLDFELNLFSNNTNNMDGVLKDIVTYARAELFEKDLLKRSLLRKIQTSGHLLNESEVLLAFVESVPGYSKYSYPKALTGYREFKSNWANKVVTEQALSHGVDVKSLQRFVSRLCNRKPVTLDSMLRLFPLKKFERSSRAKRAMWLILDLADVLRAYSEPGYLYQIPRA